jgi:hypothetical protein
MRPTQDLGEGNDSLFQQLGVPTVGGRKKREQDTEESKDI